MVDIRVGNLYIQVQNMLKWAETTINSPEVSIKILLPFVVSNINNGLELNEEAQLPLLPLSILH